MYSSSQAQTSGQAAGSKAGSPAPAKQVVDYTTLTASCHEIAQSWVPAKVEQVVMYGRTDLALRLRTLQGNAWLHVSWHPVASRVCVGSEPPRGAIAEGFTLAEQLSDNLNGLVLVGATMPQAWERVLQLHFGARPGEPATRRLYCEVMARYSNVILTDDSDQILACAMQIGSAKSSLRLLQTGRQYQLPPVTSGIAPSTCADLAEWRSVVTRAAEMTLSPASSSALDSGSGGVGDYGAASGSGSGSNSGASSSKVLAQSSGAGGRSNGAGDSSITGARSSTGSGTGSGSVAAVPRAGRLVDGLTRAFNGVSPLLVEELCARAGSLSPNSLPSALSDERWHALWEQWRYWLDCVAAQRFIPSLDQENGRFSVLGSYVTQHDSVQQLLEDYYSTLQASELHAQLHQRLTSTLRAALKKAQGKQRAFQQQLGAADGADEVQMQADMITANMWRIKPGDVDVEVESWTTGEVVKLQLDAAKTPVQVAEALYKRARKLRRAVDAVQPLLEAAQQETLYLEEVESSLSTLARYSEPEDYRALQEVQEELVQQGYLKPDPATLNLKAVAKAKKAGKKASKRADAGGGGESAATGFRCYTSPAGLQILIGRNNRQNDDLSNRVANPNDVWMHVRGIPGSHAVIRVPSSKNPVVPSDEDLQCCADLAAYYSKARDNGKVDVIVALAANLKKPKGAKPGQILVTKELRNIVARPSLSAAAAAAGGQQ